MTQATDSTPILARPHILRGVGHIRLTGTGEIVLRLEGEGRVKVQRGAQDSVHFSGQGRTRHVSADTIMISGARGHLVVDGTDLCVTFSGGPISMAVHGHFHIETEGSGLVETTRGERIRWDAGQCQFRLEGAQLVLAA